ncbi:hypothetical protein CS063_16240 [Sporanaerobium hydrogeniformans]|uniref:Uncharacterized protein n=1 Tax=Sporanaerobium hydrogeniformans TaxID=3072179 RepID=A0AC61D6Q6_9FIRM|nr:sensor histidine kinase [Sporanaerobium hydrogeniformans]PHV69339.1 hypothetical protein CS063_16240 [Sporanaerobium hydrogeniformans]
MKKDSRILQYIQDYRFNSILVKSFGIILGLLILTYFIIIFAVSHKMDRIIAEEVGNMSTNALAKTRDRIDVVMNEAVQIAGQLSLDEEVYKFLLPDTKELFGRDQVIKVKNKIEMYSGVFDYIDTIYIYSNKSKYIVTNSGGGKISEFDDMTWFDNLIKREYEPNRMISRVKYGTYPYLISYIHPIRLTQMQFLGGIIVNIDTQKLEDLIIANIKASQERLVILDDRDNIIFSSNRNEMGKKIDQIKGYENINYQNEDGYQIIHEGKEDLLVAVDSSKEFKWKYISLTPLSAYAEYHNSIQAFYGKLLIACIILSIIATFIIALYCYTPVKSILDLLKNPDTYGEDYEGGIGLKKDEIHDIAVNIIRNLYSNKQLQQEMKEYTNIINKAQLTALQAQISPHFMYNTLENIRWRSITSSGGENEISQIILNLSEMLRISLETNTQIISIEEEIHNAKLYIEILQLRYEDKIKVEWDVEEEVLKHSIVKVSLQPLIENAVYHGIKPLRRLGIITISIKKEDKYIIIYVKDNGIGMDQEEVNCLNQDMVEKYTLQQEHIGIRNVNQRLKLLMGDEAGISIASSLQEGTIVTVTVPI